MGIENSSTPPVQQKKQLSMVGWDGDVWDCNKEEIGFTLKLSCVRQAGEVRGAGDSVVILNGGW